MVRITLPADRPPLRPLALDNLAGHLAPDFAPRLFVRWRNTAGPTRRGLKRRAPDGNTPSHPGGSAAGWRPQRPAATRPRRRSSRAASSRPSAAAPASGAAAAAPTHAPIAPSANRKPLARQGLRA